MAVRIKMPGSPPIEVTCDTVADAVAFLDATHRRPRKSREAPTEAAIADKIGAWLHRMAERVEPTAVVPAVLRDVAEGIRRGDYWPSQDATRKKRAASA